MPNLIMGWVLDNKKFTLQLVGVHSSEWNEVIEVVPSLIWFSQKGNFEEAFHAEQLAAVAA